MLARVARFLFGGQEFSPEQPDQGGFLFLATSNAGTNKTHDSDESLDEFHHPTSTTSNDPYLALSPFISPLSKGHTAPTLDASVVMPLEERDSASVSPRDDHLMTALLGLGDIYDTSTLISENDPFDAPPFWSSPLADGEASSSNPKPTPKQPKAMTGPSTQQPSQNFPWEQLIKAGETFFGLKTSVVSYQSRTEPTPVGLVSLLLIRRPNGYTRTYMSKDRKGSRTMLCQMALNSGALDFMGSGDDTAHLKRIAIDAFADVPSSSSPEAASGWSLSRFPERIETSLGYVYTQTPTAMENPPLMYSQDAMRIQCWCEKVSMPGVGVQVEARWLITMSGDAGRPRYGTILLVRRSRSTAIDMKTWSVNSVYNTQDLALDAVSSLAVYEHVDKFIAHSTPRIQVIQGRATETMEPILPLAAVSHGAFTPVVQDTKGSAHLLYKDYKSQVPIGTGGSPPRKTIVEYVESLVYDVVTASGVNLKLTYTSLRNGPHTAYGCLLRLGSTPRGGSSSSSDPSDLCSYSWLTDAIFITAEDAKKAACLQAICLGEMREFISSLTQKHSPTALSSSKSAGPMIVVTEKMEQDFIDTWHDVQTACLKSKVMMPIFQYHGHEDRRGADMIVTLPTGQWKTYTIPNSYVNTRSARVAVVLKASAMGVVGFIRSHSPNPTKRSRRSKRKAAKAANVQQVVAASVGKAASGSPQKKTAVSPPPPPPSPSPSLPTAPRPPSTNGKLHPIEELSSRATPQHQHQYMARSTQTAPRRVSRAPPRLSDVHNPSGPKRDPPPIVISPVPNEMFIIDDRRYHSSRHGLYDTQYPCSSNVSSTGLSLPMYEREDGEVSDADADHDRDRHITQPRNEEMYRHEEPDRWLHDLPQVRHVPKRRTEADTDTWESGTGSYQREKRARYM